MVGAAASWFAACAGGRVRDDEVSPHALLGRVLIKLLLVAAT
jgi:hypothetical protein